MKKYNEMVKQKYYYYFIKAVLGQNELFTDRSTRDHST